MKADIATMLTLGARFVGLAFLWAGLIKAVAPHTFRAHLDSLAIVPRKKLGVTVTLAAALEVSWGTALVVGFAPAAVYPMTIALLIMLSFVSWWGVQAGKAKDCGCYGGFVQPSIAQSVSLNAFFVVLVSLAWIAKPQAYTAWSWQILAVVALGIVAGGLTAYAQWFEAKRGRLLFDTQPLKTGKKWRDGWADGLTGGIDGEILVGFLSPHCPHCSTFVRIANAMTASPLLPRVVGVMGVPDKDAERYVSEKGIQFPVATISSSLMQRLAQSVPTAVLINQGRIQTVWIGNMPPSFVDRFRDAFFPGAAKVPDAVH